MNDVYRSYYTKSAPIVAYMMRLLDPQPGDRVLDPCAGDGVFVEALQQHNVSIDAVELNPAALEHLRQRFSHCGAVNIIAADMLTVDGLGPYDRIIANPPYGGWLDYEQRRALARRYPGLYVKETYALFLYRCIQLLAPGGTLVFIMPDTWLNLHRHIRLREFILTHTQIKEIALFPSAFFPGVNFGYANLCIVALQRNDHLDTPFQVLTGFASPEDLQTGLCRQRYTFNQRQVYTSIDHALFIADDPQVTHLINHCDARVGDVAACVTGFYSGSDRRFLRTTLEKPGYRKIDADLIYLGRPPLDGLSGPRCFVPIMKGGGVSYLKPDTWFVDWSTTAVAHYRADQKARFQNADYYFRSGIGVPMVSSRRISGALIAERIFDQSIVGVFPDDPRLLYYLLAFFNSPTCNRLIRTINPTANNSANYIKKIPLLIPPDVTFIERQVGQLIEGIRRQGRVEEAALHERIATLYGF